MSTPQTGTKGRRWPGGDFPGREGFADFRTEFHGTDTALIGELDQPGLYGALFRLQSLGLEQVLSRIGSTIDYQDPGLLRDRETGT